jgi:hypothetical protein
MLIGEHRVEELVVEVFDRIDDLDAQWWDCTLAAGHPFKTHGFMRASEQVFMHRQYRYLRIRAQNGGQPLGLLFATKEALDICADAGERVQSILRRLRAHWPKLARVSVAMLGSHETSGQHWWFADAVPAGRHMMLATRALELAFPRARIRVIRDIAHDAPEYAVLRDWLQAKGFHATANYPLAVIPMNGLLWSEHCQRLKANCRKILNRMVSQYQQSGWRIVHHENIPSEFEILYEQYLNTHRKASEFKRDALRKRFFQQIHQKCRSVFSVLYDTNDQVRAFIFSGVSETIINPFIFGRDYREDSGVNAYYVLHMDLIRKFSSPRTQHIDLGITNYFLKQNFGARLQRNDLYLKVGSPLVNAFLGPAIARQFSVPQPNERDVFKHEQSA